MSVNAKLHQTSDLEAPSPKLINASGDHAIPPLETMVETRTQGGAVADMPDDERVAVIITTYNHAKFLAEAIRSVLGQSLRAAEIVVVDDGSTDRPEDALVPFPEVRLVKQPNLKVAAARNRGLRETSSPFVVFLDADDRLLPRALAGGLATHLANPGSGFVYGGMRRVDIEWRPISKDDFTPPGNRPHQAFFGGDIVRMPAAAMYRRSVLEAVGGFDETLVLGDDYEMYLRLSAVAPVAGYADIIAEYRWHGGNVSGDPIRMMSYSLAAQRRYRPADGDPDLEVWRRGRRAIRSYYVREAMALARRTILAGRVGKGMKLIAWGFVSAPDEAIRSFWRAARRRMFPRHKTN